jgi:hypothetical protein
MKKNLEESPSTIQTVNSVEVTPYTDVKKPNIVSDKDVVSV